MNFKGFKESDFTTFQLDGLEERMKAIQDRIQPKFESIGEEIKDDLASNVGHEMFLHIARHARRKVNPPSDTWSAYCHDKRGYKKHPHFQIGLFDDHVFIWLAFIYELPNKSQIAQHFIDEIDSITEKIPNDFVISLDHMKKDAEQIDKIDLEKSLTRFRDVKKAEFLIGRHIKKDDPILQNGEEIVNLIKDTFETLTPIYKMSFR